jgi:hypothetical protein
MSPASCTAHDTHPPRTNSWKTETPVYKIAKWVLTAFLRSNRGQNLTFVFLAKKLLKSYIWSINFYGTYTWILQKVDQSFEMWCWREMEEINLTNGVKIGELLHKVKEKWNILHTIKRKKAKWIGYILRWNCFLKCTLEGKI